MWEASQSLRGQQLVDVLCSVPGVSITERLVRPGTAEDRMSGPSGAGGGCAVGRVGGSSVANVMAPTVGRHA